MLVYIVVLIAIIKNYTLLSDTMNLQSIGLIKFVFEKFMFQNVCAISWKYNLSQPWNTSGDYKMQ